MKPLCIDLFAGLGGWSDGFLAEGYQTVGFDIERHDYGTGGYPGELVLQDVLTLHGRQFKNAACIVCSPPCQEYSYMAMPWKRAKQIATAIRDETYCGDGKFPEGYTGSRTIAQLTALFDACFRIQREASEAAGHHIPMVVENVKGAQPWVGRAQANYGSFYLWGDVRSIGGRIVAAHQVQFGAPAVKAYRAMKCGHPERSYRNGDVSTAHLTNRSEHGHKNSGGTCPVCGTDPFPHHDGKCRFCDFPEDGRKVPMNFHEHEKTGKGRSFQSAAVESTQERSGLHGTESDAIRNIYLAMQSAGVKSTTQHAWFNDHKKAGVEVADSERLSRTGSKSSARKAASAQIAKIPLELSRHIARCFKPTPDETLRSGYDPERENEAPRRSAEWNRALGWVDALHDEARVWCEKGNTPATVNIVAESVNSAGLANERKQGEGCGK